MNDLINDVTKVKGMAGNVPVMCAHDTILPLSQIKANPKNPNTHSPEQIEVLKKVIEKQGWRSPIVISNLSGYVVKGHGRLIAALDGDMEFAPVDYQDYESEAAEYADMTADNQIAEMSHMDPELLAEIFIEIESIQPDFDFSLTGFDQSEIDQILGNMVDEMEEALEAKPASEKYELIVACTNEEELERIYNKLLSMNLAVKKKISGVL